MQGSVNCSTPRGWHATHAQGKSFLTMEQSSRKTFLTMLNDFAIKPTPTSVKNPQANAILERVHQVLGDMLCTKELQKHTFDEIDPWSEILASVAWAIRSTHHTILQASPAQLILVVTCC